jgi:hypothetical protein
MKTAVYQQKPLRCAQEVGVAARDVLMVDGYIAGGLPAYGDRLASDQMRGATAEPYQTTGSHRSYHFADQDATTQVCGRSGTSLIERR